MAAVHESKNSNSAPQPSQDLVRVRDRCAQRIPFSQWQVVVAPIVAWTDRFGLAEMESYRLRKSKLGLFTLFTKLQAFGLFLPLFDEIS